MSMNKADILVDAINYELDRLGVNDEVNKKITKWVNELAELADKNADLLKIIGRDNKFD